MNGTTAACTDMETIVRDLKAGDEIRVCFEEPSTLAIARTHSRFSRAILMRKDSDAVFDLGALLNLHLEFSDGPIIAHCRRLMETFLAPVVQGVSGGARTLAFAHYETVPEKKMKDGVTLLVVKKIGDEQVTLNSHHITHPVIGSIVYTVS